MRDSSGPNITSERMAHDRVIRRTCGKPTRVLPLIEAPDKSDTFLDLSHKIPDLVDLTDFIGGNSICESKMDLAVKYANGYSCIW